MSCLVDFYNTYSIRVLILGTDTCLKVWTGYENATRGNPIPDIYIYILVKSFLSMNISLELGKSINKIDEIQGKKNLKQRINRKHCTILSKYSERKIHLFIEDTRLYVRARVYRRARVYINMKEKIKFVTIRQAFAVAPP